jgi:endonuclease YncB( thermonuclease family)
MTTPTIWNVDRVVRVVDGDSLRVVRSRTAQLGDGWFNIRDHDIFDGVPIRLLWVNTPERGQPGYTEARADLQGWIAARTAPDAYPSLRVVVHYPDAFGRLLADLIDADGNSASQWLMIERGWPPYKGGAA